MDTQAAKAFVMSLDATGVNIINVSDIVINDEFRGLCEQNSCGNFGRNYMCPPSFGTMEECRERVSKYTQALIIEVIYDLEDSFDFEGMMLGKEKHSEIMRKTKLYFDENYNGNFLALAAGGCTLCEKCGKITDTPCPNPHLTMPPVEGYGMDVTNLAELADMPFKWGESRVFYIGAILYNDSSST